MKKWWSKFNFFSYLQFSAGVTHPGDIKIIETDASGTIRESTGLTFGEDEIIEGEELEEDDGRGGWDNKLDFLFSCISVSVGLGSKFFKSHQYNLKKWRLAIYIFWILAPILKDKSAQ